MGNAGLRAKLWMPTLRAVTKNPWLKSFYDRLVAQGKGQHSGRPVEEELQARHAPSPPRRQAHEPAPATPPGVGAPLRPRRQA
jgi:hypothetical protein